MGVAPAYLGVEDLVWVLWGAYMPPPLKTRLWEAYINAPLVFADFWKKVRIFPPVDGPTGGTALFSKTLRK